MRKIARQIQAKAVEVAGKAKNKIGTAAALCAGATMVGMNNAQAAFDTNITGLATDASDFFENSIKPLKIAVVGFFIVLSFVAMVKGRR